jgi:hypothetical protein
MKYKFTKEQIEDAIDSLKLDLKDTDITYRLYLKALNDYEKKLWADEIDKEAGKNDLIKAKIAELEKMLTDLRIVKFPDWEGRN